MRNLWAKGHLPDGSSNPISGLSQRVRENLRNKSVSRWWMCAVRMHGFAVVCACVTCGTALLLTACGGGSVPKKDSAEYAKVVSAFYIGLGALQVGDDIHAETNLSSVTQMAAGEPADFVVCDGDPFAPATRVTQTWIAGEQAWPATAARPPS